MEKSPSFFIDHKTSFSVNDFIKGDQQLMESLFQYTFQCVDSEINLSKSINQIIKQKMISRIDQIEESMIIPIKKMMKELKDQLSQEIDDYCLNKATDRYKQINLIQQMMENNQNQYQQQIREDIQYYIENDQIKQYFDTLNNQIDRITKRTPKYLNAIQQLMNKHKDESEPILQSINNRITIKQKQQLRSLNRVVNTYDVLDIVDYEAYIQEYQTKQQQFSIHLNFWHITSHNSRMELIQWMDQNRLWKYVNIFNQIQQELQHIDQVLKKAANIYLIDVQDCSMESMSEQQIFNKIIDLTRKCRLLGFKLSFSNRDIENEKIKIVQQFNEVLEDQEDLDQLQYMINGSKLLKKEMKEIKGDRFQILKLINQIKYLNEQ